MKKKIPVTPHITKHLTASKVKHGKMVAVDYQSYAHFKERIDREYPHLPEAERDALIVACCMTHPDHKKKHQTKKLTPTLGLFILALIALFMALFSLKAHAQESGLDRITFQNSSGTVLRSFVSPFNFKCSTNVTCSITGNTVTVSAAGGGAGGGYSVIQNGGVAIAAEAAINFLGSFSCVDNPGNTSSDCKLSASSAVSHQFVTGVDASGNYLRGRPASTDLSDFSPTAPTTSGKIPIWDQPSGTYIPGDPLVQGLLPDGSTTAGNPVAIGGYDTAGTPALHRAIWINGNPAGTEYGLVTRNIPSGTQPVSGTVTVTQATGTNLHAILDSGTTTVTQATGTNLHTVVDSAPTTAVTAAALPLPTGAATSANQATLKSDNGGTPGATNEGVLAAVANAAPPTKTETNQVALSTDLAGNLRVYNHPPNVLGCYMVNGRTGTYAGQGIGAPLFSFRWTSAAAFAVIMRVGVNVATTVVASVAGNVERELIIARSFTVSDTGGTAVTLTGNNQKMRTSQATSLVGDMRFGQPLTAGTRTLDAAPVSSVTAWLPTLFLGYDIGSGGAYLPSTTVTSQGLGGLGMLPLLNATTGQDYPIVLAQNEGIIVRIGKDAQPASATQQTYVQISWCEVSAY